MTQEIPDVSESGLGLLSYTPRYLTFPVEKWEVSNGSNSMSSIKRRGRPVTQLKNR